jgi:hypothetical protein
MATDPMKTALGKSQSAVKRLINPNLLDNEILLASALIKSQSAVKRLINPNLYRKLEKN